MLKHFLLLSLMSGRGSSKGCGALLLLPPAMSIAALQAVAYRRFLTTLPYERISW
jgi:hypothetical protein